MLKRLKNWRRDYRYRQTIKKLREELLFFGFDISDISDEEVEQGVVDLSKAMAEWGLTIEEAFQAVMQLGKYLQDAEEKKQKIETGKTYRIESDDFLLTGEVFEVNEVEGGYDVFVNCTLTGDEYGCCTKDVSFELIEVEDEI